LKLKSDFAGAQDAREVLASLNTATSPGQ